MLVLLLLVPVVLAVLVCVPISAAFLEGWNAPDPAPRRHRGRRG